MPEEQDNKKEELSVRQRLSRLTALFGAAALVWTGVHETASYFDHMEHFDRYKEGTFYIIHPAYNYNTERQCIVEDKARKLDYVFMKSTSVSTFQRLYFEDPPKPETLGTLPNFNIVNAPCSDIKDSFKKWASWEQYKEDNKDAISEIKANLKRLANAPGTTHLTRVYQLEHKR